MAKMLCLLAILAAYFIAGFGMESRIDWFKPSADSEVCGSVEDESFITDNKFKPLFVASVLDVSKGKTFVCFAVIIHKKFALTSSGCLKGNRSKKFQLSIIDQDFRRADGDEMEEIFTLDSVMKKEPGHSWDISHMPEGWNEMSGKIGALEKLYKHIKDKITYERTATDLNIKAIYRHPYSDLALLEVRGEMDFAIDKAGFRQASKICLPSPVTSIKSEDLVIIADHYNSSNVEIINATILELAQCGKNMDQNKFICVKTTSSDSGCPQGSGGPVYSTKSGQAELLGVTTPEINQNCTDYTAIVSVLPHVGWIHKTTKSVEKGG